MVGLDPMDRVANMLIRGAIFNPFNDDFFNWWARKIIAIEYGPYDRIDFS
jgi:hypothetical protein